MKKYFYSTLILGSALALASCSADEPNIKGNDGKTVFTVQLPSDYATRLEAGKTLGDGKDVNKLYYSLLSADGSEVIINGSQDWTKGSLSSELTLDLVPGQEYQIVFFALNTDAENAYTFDGTTASLKINYDAVAVNNDAYDAFYTKAVGVSSDKNNGTINLVRPFAQLNIGTNDLSSNTVVKYGLQNYKTAVEFEAKNIVSGVSFLTKDNTLDYTLVEDPFTISLDGLENLNDFAGLYPVSGYEYLNMMYILVQPTEDGPTLVDAAFNVTAVGTKSVNLANLPLRANYQTNVSGAMLTNPQDFSLNVVPGFAGTLEAVSTWNGEATDPVVDEVAKTVTMNKASDYAGLVNMVNGGNNFAGYTVKLNTDLDMAGKSITPLAASAMKDGGAFKVEANAFQGVLDGQNHTISNLVINGQGGANNAAAVFAGVSGENAAIKNLKFENLTIENTVCEQTGIVGLVGNGATVENVHLLSGTISGTKGVGGVVGRVLADGTVSNCSNAATVKGSEANTGGVVGAAYYTAVGKTMTISGCENKGAVINTSASAVTGGIVGLSAANVTNCTNSGKITAQGYSVGGIVGEQQNYGTITKCTNTADITNTLTSTGSYGTGGIIGWIRYSGATNYYPLKGIVTVKGCNNSGNINGGSGSGVGGIVGAIYNYANIEDCTNTATSLIGGQWISGIVGGEQDSETPVGMTVEEFGPHKILLKGNETTTTLDQMSGGTLKSLLIYINNPSIVVLEGNTPESNS